MERYESLGPVGEGSYGTVLKCRHRESGRLVAIKKFMDSDDDKTVKKIALREIRLLRQLRHDNLVHLLEVWKRRRRWYLVFEFVDRTLLDDLEQNPSGLDLDTCRRLLYQILRAAAFCHLQNIIHRDIKLENVLVTQGGVVKLCDFGFARTVAAPPEGGVYTDYVATRWYRAPELLVGDIKYGKPVDVWAIGCLLMEMLSGQPLFPGDSDLDQIHHIVRCFGNLTTRHQELFHRNPVFSGVRLPECSGRVSLQQRFPLAPPTALDLAQSCLQMEPERRAQCSELLEHLLFTQDSFHIRFLDELNANIQKGHRENSTLPKITRTPRQDRDEGDERTRRGRDRKPAEDVEDNKVKKTEKSKAKPNAKHLKTLRNASEASSRQARAVASKAPVQSCTAVRTGRGGGVGAERGRSKASPASIRPGQEKTAAREDRQDRDTRRSSRSPSEPPDCGGPTEATPSKPHRTAADPRSSRGLRGPSRTLSTESLLHPKGSRTDQKEGGLTEDLQRASPAADLQTCTASPPPPPPPPSSTPLPLPLTSSGHLSPAGLRCLEKRHHGGGGGGGHARPTPAFLSGLVGGSFTCQASEKNLTCERSFLSDGDGGGGAAVAKNKSHLHFPDVRRSAAAAAAELRSREGRRSKSRRDKHLVPSSPEPVQPDGAGAEPV